VTDSTGSFSYSGFGPSVPEDHIARIEADGFISQEYLLPDAAEKVHTGFWRLTVALEQTDAG
jgi:hypothetical protein